MLRIILHGCCGHMGRVVSGLVSQEEDLVIAAGIDAVTDDTLAFPVYTDPDSCKEDADVIIDFSVAAAADALLAFAKKRRLPLVMCTTGLSETQLAAVKEASAEIPILRSGNMSLGINTIAKLVEEAARILMPAGFDVEIEEMHHRRKLDAPSGTALLLADRVKEAAQEDLAYTYDRSQRSMARPAKEIGISSLRGGTVVGEHAVIFAGEDEVIKITHSAFSRAIFGKGALSAARFLADKTSGLYSMPDVIG